MSAQKKVEKMLDRYSAEELLGDDSIDMTPFIAAAFEALGCEDDELVDAFGENMDAAIEALEIEDDRDLLWNRSAFLFFTGTVEDGEEDLEELYRGAESQVVTVAVSTFADALEEEEDPDMAFCLNLHLYLRDFCETAWKLDGDMEMANELLWQAEKAAWIYCEAEEYGETYGVASAALELWDGMEEDDKDMREAAGLLWYYLGEGEEDDDTAEDYYRNAIELLDDDEILDDPVDEDTPGLLEDLKADWEGDGDEE